MSRRDRSGLREAIIQASLELGGELGAEGLTMRGIAARLGVSATALYQHFESKGQILREIRFYGLERLAEALSPEAKNPDPLERLAKMAGLYIAFARANPWLYSLLMMQDEVEWKELPDDEVKALLVPLEFVRGCLREGVDAGRLRSGLDVVTASFQLWAAMHGLSSLLLSGRISEQHPAFPVTNEQEFVENFVGGMLGGFTG